MLKLYYLIILYFFVTARVIYSIPEGPFPDAAFDKNIKTVSFHKAGLNFSYPILELGETGYLLLGFDVLMSENKNLTYSVIHCNVDWTQSRLSYQEYMDGFFQN